MSFVISSAVTPYFAASETFSVCSVSDISALSVTGSDGFLVSAAWTSAKFPNGLSPMSSASPKAASLVLIVLLFIAFSFFC